MRRFVSEESERESTWYAEDPWDDVWENQGSPLTVAHFFVALRSAANGRWTNLPVSVEIYDGTGIKPLVITGVSFTGDGETPSALTITVAGP